MEIRSGNEWPAGALSNFAPHPFVFRGVNCNSMEGFLQSLKFKPPAMQLEVCLMVGLAAKRKGSKKNWQETQTLWWQGMPIKRNSIAYQQILDEAFNSLFQNKKAKNALLATNSAVLTHSIGRTNPKETILTRNEFISRLQKIRSIIQMENNLGS